MKPIKKAAATPRILTPINQRTSNTASPVGHQTPVGDFVNPDKDYSKWSQVPPQEINRMHFRDDVDTSAFSHHHTLGPKKDQASPGNHDHTGTISRKLGEGLGLTLVGAKGGNVALTNLIAFLSNWIEFTDSTT